MFAQSSVSALCSLQYKACTIQSIPVQQQTMVRHILPVFICCLLLHSSPLHVEMEDYQARDTDGDGETILFSNPATTHLNNLKTKRFPSPLSLSSKILTRSKTRFHNILDQVLPSGVELGQTRSNGQTGRDSLVL